MCQKRSRTVPRPTSTLGDGGALPGDGLIIRLGEPRYPRQLLELYDPPQQIYARGEALASLDCPMVAVVGARACSGYGQSVASSIGRALAAAGLVVVSGLARGVDSAAHRGAIESGGPTLAVLGCGVDVVYPRRNRELAAAVRVTVC